MSDKPFKDEDVLWRGRINGTTEAVVTRYQDDWVQVYWVYDDGEISGPEFSGQWARTVVGQLLEAKSLLREWSDRALVASVDKEDAPDLRGRIEKLIGPEEPVWWCCAADYPNHEKSCRNYKESQSPAEAQANAGEGKDKP